MSSPVGVLEASAAGSGVCSAGVVTHEYVRVRPYGMGRIVLPFAPRTDGIVVVQLAWGAVAYVREECVERVDDYLERTAEKERLAKKELQASAKKAKQQRSGSTETGKDVAAAAASVVQDLSTHIAFAPLKVPLYRRRQTFALFFSSFFSLWCCALALLCIRAQGWIFYTFLAYMIWMFLFQDYHKNGHGFKSNAFRRMKWWNWFRDYFPISLHATATLDPQQKYVFCYHPHGILSLGAFLNFGSEATGFSQKFPGIDLRLLTLTSNFRIPFYGQTRHRRSCHAHRRLNNTMHM
jgi:hypothetical protein